jgi:hypothetical protein
MHGVRIDPYPHRQGERFRRLVDEPSLIAVVGQRQSDSVTRIHIDPFNDKALPVINAHTLRGSHLGELQHDDGVTAI